MKIKSNINGKKEKKTIWNKIVYTKNNKNMEKSKSKCSQLLHGHYCILYSYLINMHKGQAEYLKKKKL